MPQNHKTSARCQRHLPPVCCLCCFAALHFTILLSVSSSFLTPQAMEIVYVYQRKRRDFGRQCLFADRPAEIIADVQPDPKLRDQYVAKNPVEAGVQTAKEYSEHEVGEPTVHDPVLMH